MVDLGIKIKELRNEKHLTQARLADRIGITKSMISAYEMQNRLPSYDILIKLAAVFNVTTDFLLGLDYQRSITTANLSDSQLAILANLVEEFERSNQKQRGCG